MPSIQDLKNSKYLTKNDVEPPIVATITGYEEVNVAKEGAPQDMKYVLHFDELEKPMCLNSTNGQIIAKITGSDDFDGWTGKRVELYNDPNVSYAGQLTGGIRVRAPGGSTSHTRQAKPTPTTTTNNGLLTWDKAIKECIAVGITQPEVVRRLKELGMKGYSPERDTSAIRGLIAEKLASEAFDAIPSVAPAAETNFDRAPW